MFWQIFDDPGVFAQNNVIIQRNPFMFNVYKEPWKGVRKTDRKTSLLETILNKLNVSENGFHYSRFPTNFLKAFKKRLTAAF